jgi:hypothetical protein
MHNIRDIIVVLIYGIVLVLNVGLFVAWQKRGSAAETPAEESTKKSRFGRPLRRRAAQPATAGSDA